MRYTEWHYAMFPDEHRRMGKDTTLVARVTGDDYTILGIFPGIELAEKFMEVLAADIHRGQVGTAQRTNHS